MRGIRSWLNSTILPLSTCALIAAGLLTAAAAPAGAAPAAAAAAVPKCIHGWCELINHDGKCLDVIGGSTSAGTPVQQWTCNGRQQQYWAFYPTRQIRNLHSGMCLSILGNDPNPGGEVIQWNCNFTGSDRWEDWANGIGGGLGRFGIVFYSDGSCQGSCAMHPSGGGTGNGAKIYMNGPVGTSYQWFLQ
jgi:hypothetical protein